MKNNKKMKICLISNIFLLASILLILIIFGADKTTYWNFGPNTSLVVINIKIDTWVKYNILLLFISFFKILHVIISEIANPILSFNIYNPDKKYIKDFSKCELQIYGNSMYMIDAIREVLMIILNVTQFDIAIFGAIISEITGIFTIHFLLSEKNFIKDTDIEEFNEMNIV